MASVSKRSWTHKGVEKEAWAVRYVDEKGVRRSKQFDQKKPADAFKRKVEREIEDGTHTAAAETATLSDCADEFLRWSALREADGRIGQGRQRTLEIFVRLNLKPHFSNLMCRDLSAQHLERFHEALSRQYAPLAARARIQHFRLIEDFARKRGYLKGRLITAEYLKDLRGIPRAKIDTFSAEDVTQLLATTRAPTRGWPADRIVRPQWMMACAVALAAFAGLRRGEIFGLTLDDVDFEHRVLRIRHNLTVFDVLKGPKTAAGNRDVPLAGQTAAMLADWLGRFYVENPRRLIFRQSDGRAYDQSNFWQTWKALLGRAGLDRGLHFHALRHFAASWMIHNGLPITDVAGLLGHSKFDMTLQVYAHALVRPHVQHQAIERMVAAMPALPAPQG